MGVVITLGVPITKSRDYWPLNFNATGYAIGEPPLVNMGHPFKEDTVDPLQGLINDSARIQIMFLVSMDTPYNGRCEARELLGQPIASAK